MNLKKAQRGVCIQMTTKSKRNGFYYKSGLYLYKKYSSLSLMMLPVILYYIIFHYVPMYGAIIAFKDYNFADGIMHSPWIGLANFKRMFASGSFFEVFRNTLVISLYKLLTGFPAAILFAILLNELVCQKFKKTVQTISYLPHFLSWVVLGGMFTQLLSLSGPLNILLTKLGAEPVFFLGDKRCFRGVLVATALWKSVGWNSIIYLAALAGIDPQLYEAARIDGAGKFKQIVHVTLPSLVPVITIMFIFNVGAIVNDDFDQIFNLYNEAVYSVGDVISTYNYRIGMINNEYGYSTAVGLFKNVIAITLIIMTNFISKKFNDYGIW